MNRQQLEHLIRAAAHIADDEELIIFGSQAVLGQFPDAPATMLVSDEADLFPKNKPQLADVIDGTIGELSPFHDTFGYYAHGIEEATAILPTGWRGRLVPVKNEHTRGATGWCLEIHDLLISKLVAGRDKDLAFAFEAAKHHLVQDALLKERLAQTPLDPQIQRLVAGRIQRLFAGST